MWSLRRVHRLELGNPRLPFGEAYYHRQMTERALGKAPRPRLSWYRTADPPYRYCSRHERSGMNHADHPTYIFTRFEVSVEHCHQMVKTRESPLVHNVTIYAQMKVASLKDPTTCKQ